MAASATNAVATSPTDAQHWPEEPSQQVLVPALELELELELELAQELELELELVLVPVPVPW